jgi:predicted nucleic acid-binding Zn ribbon protein
VGDVDAPPAELYRRDPVAFLLYVDLHEKPRSQVTMGDVRRITGATEKQARAATSELVKLGALNRVAEDVYRPANAPQQEVEPAPAPTCRWCHGPLTGRQRMYCSEECSSRSYSREHYAREVEARGGRPDQLHCVVCGTEIQRRPRSHHQIYCSRKCQRVVERQKDLERDIAAGIAGICKTCGKPMRADLQSWCSRECRPRSRGGLHPD